MELTGIYNKEYSTPGVLPDGKIRVASRTEEESASEGDTVSFSQETLDKLNEQIGKDAMTSTSVKATLDDGTGTLTQIGFNNQNGNITWNGNTLNLSKFANTLKDDVVVKNGEGVIEVYNLTTGQKLTLNADGSKKLLEDGSFDQSSIEQDDSVASALSTALFINNRGKAASTGDSNDIIINRQADVEIDAGLGDDKIFNYSSTASRLDGGGGNDSVYSVGLSNATDIDVSDGNGYVKLLGDMKGGSVNLGTGQNLVNAAGRSLLGVSISDAEGAEASAIIAKNITLGSNISLSADLTAIDTALLTESSITFGNGVNSLVANNVSGKANNNVTITSTGTNTYQLGSVTYAKIDSSGGESDAIKITNKVSNSTFDLGKGENLFDAAGKDLKNVNISSAQGENSATTIIARSIAGQNTNNRATINLAESASGNTITVGKGIANTNINTGAGKGTVSAGSMANVNMVMGGSGSNYEQSLTVNGAVNNLDYTGSDGADTIHIKGAVNRSDIKLGDGNNSFTAQNAKGVRQKVTNTNITATGSSSTTIVMGNYTYDAQGNVIQLGAGANSVTMGAIGGKGSKGLTLDILDTTATQNIKMTGAVNRLTYNGANGEDILSILGAVNNSNLNLGGGDNTLNIQNAKGANQKVTNTNISASGQGSTSINMGHYVYGFNGNSIQLGDGANSITANSITGKGANGLTIDLSAAQNADQTLLIKGAATKLTYTGSAANDSVTINGNLTGATINLGEGDNTFTATKAKTKVTDTTISTSGDGSSTINITNFTTTKKGAGAINLGDGDDIVNIVNSSGNTAIDMGKGSANIFTVQNMNGTSLKSAGGGTYTINKGQKSLIDFTGSTENIKLNVQSSLLNSIINAGNSNTYIGSEYEADKTSTAVLSGSVINAGAGALTVDAKNVTNSYINMLTEQAGSTASLDLKVNNLLSGGLIDLGHGESVLKANQVTGTIFTRTENGSLNLEANNIYAATFNLKGDGSDTIKATNNLNANFIFNGTGADSISAGGAISGSIKTDDDIELTASNLSGLNATLKGNNTINTNHINNSVLTLGSGTTSITELPTETGEPDPSGNYRLNISGSTIKSGSDLNLKAHNVSSSTINMSPAEDAEALLDMELTGSMKNSTVNLSGGNSTITAAEMQNSNINRKKDGDLTLNANKIFCGTLSFGGTGNDKITVSGNMSATVAMGAGADEITVGGDISGKLTNTDKFTVTANGMKDMEISLENPESVLDITKYINNSKINLGSGNRTLGNAGITYTNTRVTATDGNNTILGSSYVGGSINMGNGDNNINITDTLSTTIKLGSGENTVGTANTTLTGLSFNSTGSNTISGKDLTGGKIYLGGENQNNNLLLSGLLQNSTIQLNGGTNTIGGQDLSMVNTIIESVGTGSNSIEAASLNKVTVKTGESDDTLDVYGNIIDSNINLGSGVNTIRNTLSESEVNTGIIGQGSATGNKVQNSTIIMNGNTNAYLGQVQDESAITASGTNNINLAGLKKSSIDASESENGHIEVGTVNGDITIGLGDKLNINNMQTGTVLADFGKNSIVVGELGERAKMQVGEDIHSTTVHINNIDGKLDLMHENYGGIKQGNFTVADTTYAGTVTIGGQKANGSGTATAAVDTSGFGLGSGSHISGS